MKKIFLSLLFTLCSFQSIRAMNIDQELIKAAQTGEVEEVQHWLDAGADIEAKSEHGCTVLIEAIHHRQFEVCKLLLERNANPNTIGEFGYSALVYATEHSDQTPICELLLKKGIDPHTILYAFIMATQRGFVETAKLYLEHDADVNALHGVNSNTSLMVASQRFSFSLCQLLLDHNADLTLQNKKGRTAFICGAESNPRYLDQSKKEAYFTLLINHQKCINAEVETTLLCLNNIRHDADRSSKERICAQELYSHFKELLLPHMRKYAPLKQLLSVKDKKGMRACDYLQLDCLNPVYANSGLPTRTGHTACPELDRGEAIRRTPSTPDNDTGWLPNCAIQ